MQTKKITIVAIVVEATAGGVGKHVIDLITNLDKNNFDIHLIYSLNRSDKKFLSFLNSVKNEITLVETSMKRNLSPVSDMLSILKLASIFYNLKPDVIHLHAAKAGLLGKIAAKISGRSFVIYSPHGGIFHKFKGRLGSLYKFVENLFAKDFVQYVAQSKYLENEITKNLRINKNQVRTIYNGIKTYRELTPGLELALLKEKLGVSENDFLVLFPALLREEKGHINLIEAVNNETHNLNSNIKFIIAGEGPLLKSIKETLIKFKLSDKFLMVGFIEDLHPYYQISDVIILPSKQEIFPYAIIEGMLYNKHVLATNVGGVPEMITSTTNGQLFEYNEMNKLVMAINQIYNNKENGMPIEYDDKKYVGENFSLNLMINNIEKLYFTLTNGNHN